MLPPYAITSPGRRLLQACPLTLAVALSVCQVVSGFDLLSGGDCLVETFPEVGLAAISAPEPLHYYSLFSHTIGCDVVVSGR